MSEAPTFTIRQLTDACRGRWSGSEAQAEHRIRSVATLVDAGPDDVSWVVDERRSGDLSQTCAGAIVGREALVGPTGRGIISDDPELAIAEILDLFHPAPCRPQPGIHPTAVVDPSVKIGTNCRIGACAVIHERAAIGANTIIHEGVSIGRDVAIGRDCEIFDRCVIYDRCQIGDRVAIHAGAVIGADGFGFIFRDGRHRRNAHIGTVIIEDDVEIGANSCIDRAKVGATRIGRGSKIDNLVQVAHNVQIGPFCVLAAQVGLSGSARVETGAALGGQVGVAEGAVIEDGARVAAQSGVMGRVPAGQVVMGLPPQNIRDYWRDQARIRKLARLFDQVTELSRRVAELETATNHPGGR